MQIIVDRFCSGRSEGDVLELADMVADGDLNGQTLSTGSTVEAMDTGGVSQDVLCILGTGDGAAVEDSIIYNTPVIVYSSPEIPTCG